MSRKVLRFCADPSFQKVAIANLQDAPTVAGEEALRNAGLYDAVKDV